MTLSDKRIRDPYLVIDGYKHKDVKAFIKELKKKIDTAQKDFGTLEIVDKEEVQNIIDAVAGDKLCH